MVQDRDYRHLKVCTDVFVEMGEAILFQNTEWHWCGRDVVEQYRLVEEKTPSSTATWRLLRTIARAAGLEAGSVQRGRTQAAAMLGGPRFGRKSTTDLYAAASSSLL